MKSYLFIILLICGYSVSSSSDGIDLHSHLFMEHGVPGWLHQGCFTCSLEALEWSDLVRSKANEETLVASRLNIVVASLYGAKYFSHKPREAIRRQVEEAKRFVQRHSGWVLAVRADQARQALTDNKQVLVLSLEGADGVLENDADIREFISEGQISIVTPIHLVDDEYGGAALLRGYHGLINFIALARSFFNSIMNEDVRTNKVGLRERGNWLMNKLLEHRVWIDLTHASDRSQSLMLATMAKYNQPILFTHSVLREYYGAERGLAKWHLDLISEKGGMVGLLPSGTYLEGTPNARCPFSAFQHQYNRIADVIGRASVAIGSDFNAPIAHLRGICDAEKKFSKAGFWKQDQIPELWHYMNETRPGTVDPRAQVEKFIELWAKIR